MRHFSIYIWKMQWQIDKNLTTTTAINHHGFFKWFEFEVWAPKWDIDGQHFFNWKPQSSHSFTKEKEFKTEQRKMISWQVHWSEIVITWIFQSFLAIWTNESHFFSLFLILFASQRDRADIQSSNHNDYLLWFMVTRSIHSLASHKTNKYSLCFCKRSKSQIIITTDNIVVEMPL